MSMETQCRTQGWGGGRKREEVNGTGLGEWMDGGMEGRGEGREMELPQRGDRRGTTDSACRTAYPRGRGTTVCVWGTRNWGTSYGAGRGATLWRDHPTQQKLSLPRVAGSAYHWQGAWGGGCQSPRLPDWNWSCPLTCCVGGEAKELVVSTGGRAGVGLQDFSWDVRACVPCSSAPRPHLHTPPPRKATGSSGAPPKIAMPHPLQADTWS